jgi:hypothetical protein
MVNGKPDSRITVSLNRVTGRLDAEFAPTIYFNPAGGFESLGKELWHGWQQISGAAVPNGNLTQWDLDAVDAIVNVLLDEFKRMSNE